MRRIVVPAVTLLLALTGCSGPGNGKTPESRKVSHKVLYDVFHSGDPSYKLVISYVDTNGASVPAESSSGTWSREITVSYPDVTTVAVVANASPGVNTLPLGGAVPQVECVVRVDGAIVAQQKSTRANCEAKLGPDDGRT
jgi:hypothetical protein